MTGMAGTALPDFLTNTTGPIGHAPEPTNASAHADVVSRAGGTTSKLSGSFAAVASLTAFSGLSEWPIFNRMRRRLAAVARSNLANTATTPDVAPRTNDADRACKRGHAAVLLKATFDQPESK
jgi:hypothetical protein